MCTLAAFIGACVWLQCWPSCCQQCNPCGTTPLQANVLMGWGATDEEGALLNALLGFMVALTKQSNRCHVLMATSEYGYQDWLTKRNGGNIKQAHG